MGTVTLEEAKLHLRIDGSEEDMMLAAYIAASIDYLASIGVDMAAEHLPPALKAAMLLHVGGLFEARGGPSSVPADKTWERLIAPYREAAL